MNKGTNLCLNDVKEITETIFVSDLRQEIDVTKKPSPKEPKSPGFEKPTIIPTESPVDSNKLTEQHNNDFITPSNTPLRQQSKYIKPGSFCNFPHVKKDTKNSELEVFSSFEYFNPILRILIAV